MKASVKRLGMVVLLVGVCGGIVFGGWRLLRAWRYRTALIEIRDEIDAKRHAVAARNLADLLAWKSDSDEAAYLMGLCEKELGRTDSARERWARIPSGTPFGVQAVLGRAALEVDRGRFAAAEDLIDQTLSDPRIDGFALRRFLAPLLWHQGRLGEARRTVEKNWDTLDQAHQGGSSLAVELVRLHILLSIGTTALDKIQSFLERASSLAPDDDRIWLGKANLAIRNREFDEASRLLNLCLERRPRDVPVWRARLDWAVATGGVNELRECLTHLPGEEFSLAEIYGLSAWLAEKRGDTASQTRELERICTANPADARALEKLANLESSRALELRNRAKELEQANARYKELFLRDQTLRDANEMAGLAEQLGRIFEAKALWSIALEAEPDRKEVRDALERARRHQNSIGNAGQTLAELIALPPDHAAPMPAP